MLPENIPPVKENGPNNPEIDYPGMVQRSHLVSSEFLLIWRIFAAVLHACGITADLVRGSAPKFLIYFTIWASLLSMLYFFWAAFIQIHYYEHFPDDFEEKTAAYKWFCRVTHLIFEVAFSIQLTVVLLYWIVLSWPDEEFADSTIADQSLEVWKQGIIWLILWIEVLISNLIFIPIHALWILAWYIAYIIPHVIYRFSHGPVYNSFIYTDVWTYVYILIGVMISLIHFGIGYLISKCKDRRINQVHEIFIRNEIMIHPPSQ